MCLRLKKLKLDPKINENVTELFAKAQSARIDKQFHVAKRLWKKIIDINNKYVKAYNELALTLHEEQQYICKQTTAATSESEHDKIDKIIFKLKDEAQDWLRKAIKINPNYFDSSLNLAAINTHFYCGWDIVAIDGKTYEEAVRVLQNVLKIDSNCIDAKLGLARLANEKELGSGVQLYRVTFLRRQPK